MSPPRARSAPTHTKGDPESVRRSILEAARRLVGEVGGDFTTQDLIKEAGVALQTFYRHFGGKDQLLLALLGELVEGYCEQLAGAAGSISDPVERLHLYVRLVLESLQATEGVAGPGFITTEHWRLHQIHPNEVAAATQPFADLVQRELEAGIESGQLSVADPERAAWIVNQLVMATYHHFAFMPDHPAAASAAEDIWQFCLAAIGGDPSTSARGRSRRRGAT